jgi:hypothetical protein
MRFWNLEIYYRADKSSPLNSTLSQLSQIFAMLLFFFISFTLLPCMYRYFPLNAVRQKLGKYVPPTTTNCPRCRLYATGPPCS